ncbi:MAG: hypothetical protein NZ555_08600 [Geminicoccaceae bacterium]|nr:hypothetical protein [Geminicoccaceae bacterium]MCX8102457.1 hypothetical protein [Geminicoccaceae bacterium]MDW8370121.1 hypothetical protein [Geminicoccaceae bacterium]
MKNALARALLLVVVVPANDRRPGGPPGALYRIRWLRSHRIGRAGALRRAGRFSP